MPEHRIPEADSTWAVDPLDPPGEETGNGTGLAEFPPAAGPELPEPAREVADAQPGTWPTSPFDLSAPAPDQPVPAEPPEPALPPVDVAAVLSAAVQGSREGSPVTTPVPAFRVVLRVDEEPAGVSRVDLAMTGSAAYVNRIVAATMAAFMEEANR